MVTIVFSLNNAYLCRMLQIQQQKTFIYINNKINKMSSWQNSLNLKYNTYLKNILSTNMSNNLYIISVSTKLNAENIWNSYLV